MGRLILNAAVRIDSLVRSMDCALWVGATSVARKALTGRINSPLRAEQPPDFGLIRLRERASPTQPSRLSRINLPAHFRSARLCSPRVSSASRATLGRAPQASLGPASPPRQPLVVQLRTCTTMRALTPASDHLRRRSPRLHRLTVLSFHPQPRDAARGSLYTPMTSVHGEFQASPPPSGLATTPRRNGFVILQTDSSPPVALHPASRRRSYLRLRSFGILRHGLSPC